MAVAISRYASSLTFGTINKTQLKLEELQDKQDSLERSFNFFKSSEHDLSDAEVLLHLKSIQIQLNEVERDLSECKALSPMRYSNQEDLTDELIVLNNWMLNQFQLSKSMSAEAQEVLALTIQEQFKALSIDEILYVYKNAISGKYGTVFNRIDTAVICSWIRTYAIEKQELMQARQLSKYANTSTPTRYIVADAESIRSSEKLAQFKDKYFGTKSKKKN